MLYDMNIIAVSSPNIAVVVLSAMTRDKGVEF